MFECFSPYGVLGLFVMPTLSAEPVTITLGCLPVWRASWWNRSATAGLSEVVHAGPHALERAEEALDPILKADVEEAPTDPAPSIPQADVFAALRPPRPALRDVAGTLNHPSSSP